MVRLRTLNPSIEVRILAGHPRFPFRRRRLTSGAVKVIGSFVSPYVRKVLACLELKGLDYRVDPITPFFGNDEFERLSPLRRIPVLVDGDVTLCDSSVICAYLEEAYPATPLLPAEPRDRALARWLEEYADTRLGDLLIWGLFYQRVVRPADRRPTARRRRHCPVV